MGNEISAISIQTVRNCSLGETTICNYKVRSLTSSLPIDVERDNYLLFGQLGAEDWADRSKVTCIEMTLDISKILRISPCLSSGKLWSYTKEPYVSPDFQ